MESINFFSIAIYLIIATLISKVYEKVDFRVLEEIAWMNTRRRNG